MLDIEIVLCYCGGRFMSGSYINNINRNYGYLVNGSKNWLIVESDVLADETKRWGQFRDLEMRSILKLKFSATKGPSSNLKSSRINIVGKRSLDGKENSKHYLR